MRLEELYRAAGRSCTSSAAVARTGRLLAADLNVPAAVNVAIEEGRAAARNVTAVLGLN